ncbi:MAG: hypothetical protein KME50_32315 [Nostoc desertorum CM1-VF14]|nr:hypothetical protein [Nostoc desertorum CM1-VF14]
MIRSTSLAQMALCRSTMSCRISAWSCVLVLSVVIWVAIFSLFENSSIGIFAVVIAAALDLRCFPL